MAPSSSSSMRNQLIASEPNHYIFEPFHTIPHLFANNPRTLLHTSIRISQHRQPFSQDTNFHYQLILPPHTQLLQNNINYSTPTPVTLLVWNCRGAGRSGFITSAKDLIQNYKPLVFIVLDTRLRADVATIVYRSLPYRSASVTRSLGYAGGIWLLYHSHIFDRICTGASSDSVYLDFQLKPSLLLQPEAKAGDAVEPGVSDLVCDAEQANAEQAADDPIVFGLAFDQVLDAGQAAADPNVFGLMFHPVLDAEQAADDPNVFGLALHPVLDAEQAADDPNAFGLDHPVLDAE